MPVEYSPWMDGAGGVRMGLQPLAEADWLRRPRDMAARLAERRALVATRLPEVWARTPGPAVDAAIAATAALLGRATHVTAQAAMTPAAAALPETTAGLAGCDRALLAAGLEVCEDLCLLLPSGPDHVLHAALLCAPSFWRLREKLGQPLPVVHGPVAGLEAKLGARIRAFLQKLPADRVFTRGNWHLHATGERFHPAPDDWTRAQGLDADDIANRLWLRCERQTLRRVPGSEALLFTILVYVQPLADLAAQPALARGLWDAYLGMPEDERDARHFSELAAPLRRWLDGLPPQATRPAGA